MLFSWTLLCVTLVALLVYHFYTRNRYFARLGIASPPALPLLGNLADFARIPFGLRVQQWAKDYGKVFGVYEGGIPVLVTSDIDVCQDVFVKQYENFHARKHFPLAKDPETDPYASMFTARGLRWKRLRTLSNPVFKQSNLQRSLPILESACDEFMEIIGEQAAQGQAFNVMENYQSFTCDVIARVAFGQNRRMQRPDQNPYLEFVKVFFPDKPNFASSAVYLLPSERRNQHEANLVILPEIRGPISSVFHFFTARKSKDPWYFLQNTVTELVEQRRKEGPSVKPDFIDMFLETESAEGLDIENESVRTGIRHEKFNKKILTEEIVGQLMLFLIAGYETTANALSYVTHHLTIDAERQEKARAEILDVTQGATTITHEMCAQMRYTELCIKEALRLYPLASFVQARTCMKATVVGKERKLAIPEGLVVLIDAWTIQRDKSVWGDDADEFRPERFNEIDSTHINSHWVPFGLGPRICIGQRFSIVEQKMLLARLLSTYKLQRCAETAVPLKLQGGATVIAENVYLKAVPL